MAPVTFKTLNPKAKLFAELKSGKYAWWEKVKKNPNLYIEIRKDNSINVYYQGGSVMRLEYGRKLNAYTHRKYLHGTGNGYEECADQLNIKLDSIIASIPRFYSQRKGTSKEKWSEKFIQGQYILNYHSQFIDSEFAYKENDLDIRIDLVECIAGEIRFVELKRIDDNRMVTSDMNPEILTQINNYRKFISLHTEEIISYYDRLYTIKKDLKLPVPAVRPTKVNSEPLLLIFDRWVKETEGRSIHRKNMERILEKIAKPRIKYKVINSFIAPKRTFYFNEQKRQLYYYKRFLKSIAENGGLFNGKERNFVIQEKDCHYNLFDDIIHLKDNNVKNYFSDYSIAWWGENAKKGLPSGHLVSSQIHCLNHLFALRLDEKVVRTIISKATGLEIAKVLPSPLDKDGYITFEFVFKNISLLGETHETRGANCTSIDALVYAELTNGKNILVPIEWKYTETYDGDEAIEESFGRYTKVHKGSNCQKWSSLYRANPFYELMRQTLLVEQIVKTKDSDLYADDYAHIVVCPKGNKELRNDIQTFRGTLSEKGKRRFHIIDPQELLAPLKTNKNYSRLLNYLKKRYWHE